MVCLPQLQVQMVVNNLDKKKKVRQLLRGAVLLPHATGKKKKVLVIAREVRICIIGIMSSGVKLCVFKL